MRLAASTLILVYLGAIRSSTPLLDDPNADGAHKDALSAEALASVTETYAGAQHALEAACASHGPGDGSKGDMDVVAGGASKVEQWESSIGYAAGLTSTLTMCSFLTPMLHDVALVALPWVIEVQALQHAQLQGLTLTIRRVIVLLKHFMFEKADVPRVIAIVLRALKLPAWQARGSALSFMQSLWFRFALTIYLSCQSVHSCSCCGPAHHFAFRDSAWCTLTLMAVRAHMHVKHCVQHSLCNRGQGFRYTSWTCRNFFALRTAELQALVQACDRCLLDDKLEIRSLAGATLSGLLKVLPTALAASLRSHILQQGRDAFPAGRPPHGSASLVTQQHSCVIRLAALLSSSPYIICDWCVQRLPILIPMA